MNLTFRSAALAALCNSEQRLIERWGAEAGRAVGRRLLDLAAIDADHLEGLPDVNVSTDGTRETTISFGSIVVEGEITRGTRAAEAAADADGIVITRVGVQPGEPR